MAENDAFSEDPTFGEELRTQREIRGISLKEIADSTKISKRFLEALEKNDLRTLPAPVFTRGFVREYSRYLGLNAEEMVSRYAQILRRAEEAEQQSAPSAKAPIAPPQTHHPIIRPPEPAPSKKWLWIALAAAVIVAAVFGVMLLARRAPESARPETPEAETATDVSTAAPPPVVTTSTAPPVAPVEGLELRLRLRENSWLTVEVDGERTINDELIAGTERVIRAKQSIVLRTVGNAGALELTLNGKRLASLGASGDVVRNITLDRNSLNGPGGEQR